MAEKFAAICTMPNSGTWYSHYFFHILSHLRRGIEQIPAFPREGAFPLHEFGLQGFLVCHVECPAFQAFEGPLRTRWEQLRYHTDGYNWAAPIFAQHPQFTPQYNPEVRLIYLCRNPLDQAVSFFDHGQKHKDETVLARKDQGGNYVRTPNGTPALPESPKEFFFSHNFESYLKHYLSWKLSAEMFPDQIRIIPYANLVRNPAENFASILDFMGVNRNTAGFPEHFEKALKLSSKDSIQKLENSLGHAIGRDQTDPNSRHVRDGKVAKWRHHFEDADYNRMCDVFSEWGISPSEFVFD